MGSRSIRFDDLTGKEANLLRKYTLTMTPKGAKDPLGEVSADYEFTPDTAEAIHVWLSEGDSRDLATVTRKLPVRITGDGPQNETEVMRAWAKGKGLPVKDKGALPRDVIVAYTLAHPAEPVAKSDDSSESE